LPGPRNSPPSITGRLNLPSFNSRRFRPVNPLATIVPPPFFFILYYPVPPPIYGCQRVSSGRAFLLSQRALHTGPKWIPFNQHQTIFSGTGGQIDAPGYTHPGNLRVGTKSPNCRIMPDCFLETTLLDLPRIHACEPSPQSARSPLFDLLRPFPGVSGPRYHTTPLSAYGPAAATDEFPRTIRPATPPRLTRNLFPRRRRNA